MSREMICDCGRKLRVTEAHEGRNVKCPGCGAPLTVPDSQAIRGGGGEQKPIRSRSPGNGPPHRTGSTKAFSLLLLLVLLVGGGGFAGWWFFLRTPPTEPLEPEIGDLTLIPP